jgi:hypothetical protein
VGITIDQEDAMKTGWRGLTLAVVVLLAALAFCAAPALAGNKSEGESLYTAYNIWYEKPTIIWSTNYQKGTMLPAGTEVRIVKQSSKFLLFESVADQGRFKLTWVPKHHPGVSTSALLNRFLVAKNFEEMTAGFTAEEIESIKAGEIAVGMSKDAVLMAAGYPPETRTASTADNSWFYWHDRFRNFSVRFSDDGKVAEVGAIGRAS